MLGEGSSVNREVTSGSNSGQDKLPTYSLVDSRILLFGPNTEVSITRGQILPGATTSYLVWEVNNSECKMHLFSQVLTYLKAKVRVHLTQPES